MIWKDQVTLYQTAAGEGYYDEDGEWIKASNFVESTLFCCIQPEFRSRKRAIMHRGVAVYDYITLHTKGYIQTADEHTNQEADRVEINGKLYEVAECEQWWAARRLSHYEATLVEVPEGLE